MRVTGGNPIRVWSTRRFKEAFAVDSHHAELALGQRGISVLLIVRLLDHVRIVLIILICDSLV